ncbi:MAG: hypothetical protein ACFFC7_24390 [Candidatus Hermodarchaeota archaeon]
MSKTEKVKRFLGKTTRVLLPTAASTAVGIFFPPAAAAIGRIVSDYLANLGVEVPAEIIAKKTLDAAEKIADKSVNEILEDALNSVLENKGVSTEKIELLTKSTLQPLLTDLQEAINYIQDTPIQAAAVIRQVWKEEMGPQLEIQEAQFEQEIETIVNKIEQREQTLFNRLNQLSDNTDALIRALEDRMLELSVHLAENFHQTPTIEELVFLSRSQIATVTFSSAFEIAYDSELYVSRKEPEKLLGSFFNDITSLLGVGKYFFVLLADAGLGKTWLLAHTVTTLTQKDSRLVPFFFTARKNFDQQVQLFVGSKTLVDPTRIFLQFRDLLRPKGMFPLLVIDGLDEIASPQLMRALLVVLSSLAASQIPVIVSCREADWIGTQHIQTLLHELNDHIFPGLTLPDGRTISLRLTEFTESEARKALQAYQIPLQVKPYQLLFLRKPYVVRVFADWYHQTGILPDPQDKVNFLEVFAGGSGINPTMTILGRLNIRGDTRDLMLDIFEFYLNESGQLKVADLPKRKLRPLIERNPYGWAILRSAGLFKEKEDRVTTLVTINDAFTPFLQSLWKERYEKLTEGKREEIITERETKPRVERPTEFQEQLIQAIRKYVTVYNKKEIPLVQLAQTAQVNIDFLQNTLEDFILNEEIQATIDDKGTQDPKDITLILGKAWDKKLENKKREAEKQAKEEAERKAKELENYRKEFQKMIQERNKLEKDLKSLTEKINTTKDLEDVKDNQSKTRKLQIRVEEWILQWNNWINQNLPQELREEIQSTKLEMNSFIQNTPANLKELERKLEQKNTEVQKPR